MKARVIVDIDAVCLNLMETVRRFAKDCLNLEYTLEDVDAWDVVIQGHKMWDLIVATMNDPVYCRKVNPICGAKEGIALLRETGYDVILATSRPKKFESCTRECLNGFEFNELVMNSPKDDLNGNFLVDDHTDNVLRFVKSSGVAILFGNYGWNQDRDRLEAHHEDGLVHYADNWGEVVGILSGLKKDDG